MTPQKPIYIDSPDYIGSLQFDHLKTYSLQRGEVYLNEWQNWKSEYDNLLHLVPHEKAEKLKNSERIVYLQKNSVQSSSF
jgi:hypothetical protein